MKIILTFHEFLTLLVEGVNSGDTIHLEMPDFPEKIALLKSQFEKEQDAKEKSKIEKQIKIAELKFMISQLQGTR
ncbi:MAG: hypothetical protein WC716_04460 [Chitinophagaceae bacterium]|jgi:hypothetical protein